MFASHLPFPVQGTHSTSLQGVGASNRSYPLFTEEVQLGDGRGPFLGDLTLHNPGASVFPTGDQCSPGPTEITSCWFPEA